MCGIGGRAAPGGCSAETAASLLAALQHRGPDASGVVSSDHWHLAHTRLSINDLSPHGNQPMPDEGETLWLSFNGEIYNAPELRKRCEAAGHVFRSRSDAEVVVHLWEMEGPRCLERLNGIYAFAIADKSSGEVHLCRDPLGVKPLFYVVDGDALWFASELGGLSAMGAPVGDDDVTAHAQFLTFLWIPDPRTPFTKVKSLEPGQVIRWSAGKTTYSTGINIFRSEDDDVPIDQAVSEIGDRVADAVHRQLLADVPVAIMASGGIDSSLVWQAAGGSVTQAYTIGWDELGPEGLAEDTTAVSRLSALFETPLRRVSGEGAGRPQVLPSGDLLADPAYELCSRIAEQAHADGYKVLLSGQGGDEVFGGYRRHVVGPRAARLQLGTAGRAVARALAWVPSNRVAVEYLARSARAAGAGDPLASYMQLCTYSSAARRARILGTNEAEVTDEVVWRRHRETFEQFPPQWSLLRRFRALDLAVYLPGLGLAYNDRAGMQHSVEIRVPWLDLDLVRWALRLPDPALVRGATQKWLTRGLANRVLPSEIVNRPKRGFGVPQVQVATSDRSDRGFRQGRYLGLAADLLKEHGATPHGNGRAAAS